MLFSFSFLVKNLIGLKVVGVDYPGHVAAAVKFNENLAGDYITYKGEIYAICDPTYLGAVAGIAMSKYANETNINIIETYK